MPSGAVRDLKKERYWRRIVRGQAASGLSVRAWCRKHGEKDAAFYWWRRELARRDAENSEPTFVPVCVTVNAPTDTDGGIEILLAGGHAEGLRHAGGAGSGASQARSAVGASVPVRRARQGSDQDPLLGQPWNGIGCARTWPCRAWSGSGPGWSPSRRSTAGRCCPRARWARRSCTRWTSGTPCTVIAWILVGRRRIPGQGRYVILRERSDRRIRPELCGGFARARICANRTPDSSAPKGASE